MILVVACIAMKPVHASNMKLKREARCIALDAAKEGVYGLLLNNKGMWMFALMFIENSSDLERCVLYVLAFSRMFVKVV